MVGRDGRDGWSRWSLKVMIMDGIEGVLIPGEPVYKIKHEHQLRADLSQVVDDGSLQLGEGQMEALQSDVASTFLPIRATGDMSSLPGAG